MIVIGAHAAVASGFSDFGRCISRHQVTYKPSLFYRVFPLRLDAFVIVAKSSQSRTVFRRGVHHDADLVRTVLQLSQLVRCEKASARKIGLVAQDTVKFYRMTG